MVLSMCYVYYYYIICLSPLNCEIKDFMRSCITLSFLMTKPPSVLAPNAEPLSRTGFTSPLTLFVNAPPLQENSWNDCHCSRSLAHCSVVTYSKRCGLLLSFHQP